MTELIQKKIGEKYICQVEVEELQFDHAQFLFRR